MADSIRQLIVNEVISTFEGITKANGYETNAGNNVSEWLTTPVDEDAEETIIVKDFECEIDEYDQMTQNNRLGVQVGLIHTGAGAMSTIRSMIADVQKAIKAGRDEFWGGYVYHTEPGGDTMQQTHERELIGDVDLVFYLYYKTGLFDPYKSLS